MLSGTQNCRGLSSAKARKHGAASDLLSCAGARHAFAASRFAFQGSLAGSESMAPDFNLLLLIRAVCATGGEPARRAEQGRGPEVLHGRVERSYGPRWRFF